MKKLLNLPNSITLLRFVGAAALIFIPPFGLPFYVVYTLCGLTDVLDGLAARLTRTSSVFGAKLDSAADIFFYTVMLFKMLPTLTERLTPLIWAITFTAVAVRAASYITAAVRYRKFASQHTYLNKLSSLTLFIVPYFPETGIFLGVCTAVSSVCLLSSVEELAMHLTEKEYDGEKMTILFSKHGGKDR